jgi:hypothetical protein
MSSLSKTKERAKRDKMKRDTALDSLDNEEPDRGLIWFTRRKKLF